MLVLGIETSCDETSAAVVRDGRTILSNVVSSQVKLHAEHGGVVPELASRQHLLLIEPVVKEALQKAGVSWTDIDSLAVTRGPGLPSALLVGVSTAQGLALALNKPLAGVNHLKAHLLSPFIATDRAIGERFVSLIVSGGHTMLLSGSGPKDYQVLGQTLDDAAGEAFDKGARLLGLGYPGGPAIDREAKKGRRDAIAFPRSMMEEGYAFSFSGLKTSLAQHLRKFPEAPIADVAASFQEAIVQVLVEKTLRAARDFGVKLVTASGGVSCNSRFRELLAERCQQAGFELLLAPPALCTDNAAMIAALGFWEGVKDASAPDAGSGDAPAPDAGRGDAAAPNAGGLDIAPNWKL